MRHLFRPKEYFAYAQVYDALKGDRAEDIERVSSLLQRHKPDARDVLDVACGTGSVAQGLAGSYRITGLDNSKHMLRMARRKLPAMRLHYADMAGFKLGHNFDAAYCLHNSVNHLLTHTEWEGLFHAVAAHLRPGGIFIFDVLSPQRLESMVQFGEAKLMAGPDTVTTKVTKPAADDTGYDWTVLVSVRGQSGRYRTYDESIRVASFADDVVIALLQSHFYILELFTVGQSVMPDNIGRTYYVCLKK